MREPSVLIVEASPAERELITLLVERHLPAATVTAVGEALPFADAIYSRPPDVIIASDALPWTNVEELVSVVRRRLPGVPVIVASSNMSGSVPPADYGVVCDAWVLKTASGLVRLPRLVSDVLASPRGSAPARAPAPPPEAPSTDTPADRDAAGDVALLFSHDLREPLQQIVRLVRAKGTSDKDTPTATLLRRVLQCAERANTMLDSAVEYLSLGRSTPEKRLVDLNVCLQQALDNLRTSIEESHAQVRADDLPVVYGDPEQLVHLFQNLISNAIKFRGPEIPIVMISCEDRRDEHALLFRDNGIGVPAAQAERIFGAGARLHTNDQIPGTGLGLALCRAIVQRHGGRMALESAEGQGSTFVVTLPRAPRETMAADGSRRPPAVLQRSTD